MLVKAKWNVKDANGWHDAGEVFNTENDLGEAVEVLSAQKKEPAKVEKKQEPEKEPETEPQAEAGETEKEPETVSEMPRNNSRRKKGNK